MVGPADTNTCSHTVGPSAAPIGVDHVSRQRAGPKQERGHQPGPDQNGAGIVVAESDDAGEVPVGVDGGGATGSGAQDQ